MQNYTTIKIKKHASMSVLTISYKRATNYLPYGTTGFAYVPSACAPGANILG